MPTLINPTPPIKPDENSGVQYVVIQNTGFIADYKIFVYGHVIPSLYNKIYGPATKDECNTFIKKKR